MSKKIIINDALLNRLLELSQLQITDDNKRQSMCTDLQKIIDWIQQLDEIDTDGVEPLTTMSDSINMWDEDVPGTAFLLDQALLNAPSKDSDYFHVPSPPVGMA